MRASLSPPETRPRHPPQRAPHSVREQIPGFHDSPHARSDACFARWPRSKRKLAGLARRGRRSGGEEPELQNEFIARLVRVSIDNPAVVTAIYFVLFCASTFYAVTHFAITTDTTQLIAENVQWRRLESDFNKTFPQRAGLTLVVIDAPTPERADQAASDLAARLSRETKTIS